MKTYKVVKIWYVKAENKEQALFSNKVFGENPDFVSANDKFRVDTRKGSDIK